MKEKIRQAYIEYWEQLSEQAQEMALNNFGWIFRRDSIKRNGGLDDSIEMEHHLIYTRPKSLQGIENNNGWIRIDSEDDLPNEKGDYWVIWDGKIVIQYWHSSDNSYADTQKQNSDWMKIVTHYRPIEKPKPPIY